MRRLVTWMVMAGLSAVPFPAGASEEGAVEVEVTSLLAEPETWNGRRVTVSGELVGDFSARAEGVWVQLNDDAFVEAPVAAGGDPRTTNQGIGALVPTAEFSAVEGLPGTYGRVGPIVRLEGEFAHADPERQGETYLRVESVTQLRASRDLPRPGPDVWIAVGLGLFLAAGLVTWTSRRTPG